LVHVERAWHRVVLELDDFSCDTVATEMGREANLVVMQ
jgi:hypothetical protein